ncbi:hypothetical protein BY458DRAFT_524403 [Sporodiniella umbellata]|nr:hypothetical protein BY458DRAFT_524403 [Sporodiniella umbellata]
MPTTKGAVCFWGMVTTDEFRFIYMPSFIDQLRITKDRTIGDVISNRSIFEYMHPNEVELAKIDFNNAVQLKRLSGSVTRCRFRALKNHIKLNTKEQHETQREEDIAWNIMDLVLYIVTSEAILVVFHNIDFSHYELEKHLNFTSCCSGGINNFGLEEASYLVSRTEDMGLFKQREAQLPFSLFRIMNREAGNTLFTLPQYTEQSSPLVLQAELLAKSLPLCEIEGCSSDDTVFPIDKYTKVHTTGGIINCTRHFYARKKLEFVNTMCYVERIVIPYGPVIFDAFQVRPVFDPPLPPPAQNSVPYTTLEEPSLKLSYSRPSARARSQNGSPSFSFLHASIAPTTSSPMFQKFRLEQIESNSKGVERKRKLVEQHTSSSHITRLSDIVPNKFNKTAMEAQAAIKICTKCHTSNSPEWRRGPDGNKT